MFIETRGETEIDITGLNINYIRIIFVNDFLLHFEWRISSRETVKKEKKVDEGKKPIYAIFEENTLLAEE